MGGFDWVYRDDGEDSRYRSAEERTTRSGRSNRSTEVMPRRNVSGRRLIGDYCETALIREVDRAGRVRNMGSRCAIC